MESIELNACYLRQILAHLNSAKAVIFTAIAIELSGHDVDYDEIDSHLNAVTAEIEAWIAEGPSPDRRSSGNTAMVSYGWVIVALERFLEDQGSVIVENLIPTALDGLIALIEIELSNLAESW
jgi:hypothetical protein